MLAYWVRTKGFHIYVSSDTRNAPIVWHITHRNKLTTGKSFWDRFWFGYDVFRNYHRYRALRADVSLKDYILASLAFIYALLDL
ncbi:MAG: hypothetical protein NZ893_01745 [Candidatus Aenigmarchaeota archaeon]|nr:hypothetical protein [Candidatus Aenigmarchaeota archaeon]